jgi:hypothetical protein
MTPASAQSTNDNPTIVELEGPLPDELVEPLARLLAHILVAKVSADLAKEPANDT